MKRRRFVVELGQEHLCPSVERFHRGNFPPGGGNRSHRHHQQLSHLGEGNVHQHLHQHHLLSNPSSSLVFNLCTGTSDWYLWVTSSVDYILQLMLIGLLGGRSYVQILNAYKTSRTDNIIAWNNQKLQIHWRRIRPLFINIFNITISSQALVHFLYSNFISKPHVGTGGLLVVLITSCS